MSLRTKLILLVAGVALVIVTAALVLVHYRMRSYFANRARTDVASARDGLKQSLADSLDAYRVQGQIIADATLLKEALVRHSAELAFTYADSARDTTKLSYLLVLDDDGAVVADGRNQFTRGAPLMGEDEPWQRIDHAQVGFLRLGSDLVAAAVVPVMLDARLLGYVVLGDPVTAKRLRIAGRFARSEITLLGLGGQRIASTLPDAMAAEVSEQWAREQTADAPESVPLDGIPHLLATDMLTGLRGEALGFVVVTHSLLDELTAMASLRRWMMALGLVFTATAIAGGVLIAHRIAGPVRQLTAAAEKIARGEPSPLPALALASNGAAGSNGVGGGRSRNEIETLSRAFGIMANAVAERQERLQKEMDLAQRLQTAILPRKLAVPGLDIAAAMLPATEVGGDYYDVLPAEGGGCWLGIGDVAGHGLNAGLTMLMIQSMVAALTRQHPDAAPSQIVTVLNDALFDNVRDRLNRREHATLSLLKYEQSGRVSFAGAHEEILIYREASAEVQSLSTSGLWLGIQRGIAELTRDTSVELGTSDVMLLYTDGATEARNADNEMFGLERLGAALAEVHGQPVEAIRDHLMDAVRGWTDRIDDDVTFLVARYVGAAAA
jgi:sigma-B regulation protein RsbU (phosphoserine phosphatase)